MKRKKEKNVLDRCIVRSYLSQSLYERYRDEAKRVRIKNGPICEDMGTFEVISLGAKKMEEDNFVLVRGIGDV